ncbi:MAG: hypothetical protein U1C74_20680 [Phenylobacterium sp.]|nr:hypothetical protein [Phenylobacterium sp.]
MRRLLAFVLAALIGVFPPAVTPALAQEGVGFFGGAGTATTPSYTRQVLNLNAGAGTQLSSGGSAHTLGSFVSLGTASTDLAGFNLGLTNASGSGRYQIQLSLNSDGSSPFFSDFFFQPSVSSLNLNVPVPIGIATGSTIYGAIRSNSGSPASINAQISGWVGTPAKFTAVDNVTTPNTGGTAPGGSATVTTSDTTFTTLNPTTSNAYKAILVTWATTAGPAAGQMVTFRFAKGGSGSEVVIGSVPYAISGSAVNNGRGFALFEADIPAGERISVNALGATGGDTILFGVMGFR